MMFRLFFNFAPLINLTSMTYSEKSIPFPEICRIRRFFLILLCSTLFIVSSALNLMALTAGDYQSATSGSWTSPSTWLRYNGTTWATPTVSEGYPGEKAGTKAVTIRTGHVVTIPNTAAIAGNGYTAITTQSMEFRNS